jgi:glycosyltransferase involved in cell wall biosynthesis
VIKSSNRHSEMDSRNNEIAALISDEGKHTGVSGYSVLSQYLGTHEVTVKRSTSPTLFEKAAGKLLRFHSASSWYAYSSLVLEVKSWWEKKHFHALHLMWADRDWGYLDRFPGMGHVPLIGTFHACPDDFESVIARPERLRRFAAVILMSEVQRANFLAAGVPNENVHVILHGIDTQYFRSGTNPLPRKGTFDVLHVGSYRRNFEVLDAVCSRLQAVQGVKVRILAPPVHAPRFASASNVEFLSGLTDAELLAVYQQADCLLMTATSATANNTIVEGMACGLPVVAENVGGIAEYVDSGCAVLCPARDDEALASAIISLFRDKAKCDGMRTASRLRAEQLDWRHVAVQTQAVYDRVLAKNDRKTAC